VRRDYVSVGNFSLEDFYTVSQIRIELRWTKNNADLDLHLYDEPGQGGNHDGWDYINWVIDENIPATSTYHDETNPPPPPEWITVDDPNNPETFYIYVYGYSLNSNNADFTITVTFQ
ncbi:MAG: hypothetical protein U9N35_00420, partial [Euryarchaeota archaeon]|nr:hypothetical protein [Euryarchaeota archaeon]